MTPRLFASRSTWRVSHPKLRGDTLLIAGEPVQALNALACCDSELLQAQLYVALAGPEVFVLDGADA